MDPKHWNARYNLAVGLHELDRLEEAIEEYERLFLQFPVDEKVNDMMRRAKQKLKEQRQSQPQPPAE